MNELHEALDDYLDIRQSLGFKVNRLGHELRQFVTFAENEGASYITVDLALRWAKQPAKAQPARWAQRLQIVRRFAVWRKVTDPQTEVPPVGLLPHSYHRKSPYIYSDKEIEMLLRATRELSSPKGLKGLTYFTMLGLISVTGIRVGEAIALDRETVDLEEGVLLISRTKFAKSRLVPVHESTRESLNRYAQERNRILPRASDPAFFISERGTRVAKSSIEYIFALISGQIGLRAPVKGRRHGYGPRIHDMRHRFVVVTLLDWYRAGIDIEAEMPKLAAFLGHKTVSNTYWYIEAVPELLELASRRLVERGEQAKS